MLPLFFAMMTALSTPCTGAMVTNCHYTEGPKVLVSVSTPPANYYLEFTNGVMTDAEIYPQ